MRTLFALTGLVACIAMSAALAAPVTYVIDPDHTHEEFEADHLGGLSVWRGLMAKSRGSIVLDKNAGTGSVDVAVDMDSVEIGQPKLEEVLKSKELFDTAKFPEAHYQGTLVGFVNGVPTTVTGQLTLHGVTRPVALKVLSFKCVPHPLYKREVCGADALGSFSRDDFGMDSGKSYGFSMTVTLHIQVEAIAAAATPAK